ncbi:hypothetical protein Mucpa_6294 [Mucilaginibacter paludis DSM 18603]|uniref:Uncharacterized protein n=2 Tax=Mucilaginibacter TaxID=423349 RepID=H1Y3T8_9SPHI|nr:hypothetical protein Mucpa_6294 [Mucilaginibacter paludis DSM 18603]
MVTLIIFGFSSNRRNSDHCRFVKLVYKLEFIKPDNAEMVVMQDTLGIIYYGNYIAYQIPNEFTLSNVNMDKDQNVISENVIREETKYSYMVYNKNKNYGYMFDSIGAIKAAKVSVDSFLLKRAFKNFPFYNSVIDSLVSTSTKNESLVETRICKEKKDESFNDTIHYFYKKGFEKIDYTFSKYLDSTRNLKLYKIQMIFNPIPKGKYAFAVPKREFLFELKPNETFNSKELTVFFENFKKRENMDSAN